MSTNQTSRISKTLIVGTGFEKCGTTTAHDILSTSRLIAAPRIKETAFFSRDFDKGLDYYNSLYSGIESAQFMLDITPSYHLNVDAYQRIRDSVSDYLVLVFVRDPIRRAFSLYWHNIVNHFSAGEGTNRGGEGLFTSPFKKTFQQVTQKYNNYCLDLHSSIRRVRNVFGDHRVVVIYFDEVEDGSFVKRIENSLQCSLEIGRTERWSNKRTQIRYDLLEKPEGHELTLLKANKVVRSWPIDKVGWPAACRALASTQHWSRYVSRDEYETIYNRLYRNMDLAAIGIDRERLFQFGDISYW